ncbi:hypothetical protein [Nocardia camponoti]|uniref:Transmembrane protein n=1 Tax=Nocardia camponoti TaxID=1616106 RepID=A0A917QE87_9NOCA|nr:hypothetical protein [Nocardia camponoti]GGK44559.1 hypothetical protein GCM10011591_15210 [Nocardia camponoti]
MDNTYRQAVTYGAAVIALTALCCAVGTLWTNGRAACVDKGTWLCDGPAQVAVLIIPAVVLLLGGIGAFFRTYVVYREGSSRWPVWQGAGWFLFILMTAYLVIGGGALAN